MSYFVDSASLQAILKDVRVIDVRGSIAYGEGHIPGAVCLDMKRDFTGETGFFPEVGRLAKTLGENGISVDTSVVIYDGGSHRDAEKDVFAADGTFRNKADLAGHFARVHDGKE